MVNSLPARDPNTLPVLADTLHAETILHSRVLRPKQRQGPTSGAEQAEQHAQ